MLVRLNCAHDGGGALYINPETVTCVAEAGLPGTCRLHHAGGMMEHVLGTPEDVMAALFGADHTGAPGNSVATRDDDRTP